jgi:hypothetical protein
MRPKVYTITASGGGNTYSPAYPIDISNNPTDIGVAVDIVFGQTSAGFSVQHTFDDPWTINLNSPQSNAVTTSTGAVWQNNATIVNSSAGITANYVAPPRALRLLLSAATSAAVRFTIVQAGPR